MQWKIEVSASAAKDLKKMGGNRIKILKYLRKIENMENPRELGKPLKGILKDLWRYRVGEYRMICEIKDEQLIVLTLKIGHRKNIYQK